MSLLAARRQVERRIRVKAVREVFVGPLPFLRILVHSPVDDTNLVTFLKMQLVTQDNVSIEDDRRDATWRLESETFTNNIIEVVEVKARVDSHTFHQPLFERVISEAHLLSLVVEL